MKTPCPSTFALFHTIGDMMTVILRIDLRSSSNVFPLALIALTSLSHLTSMHFQQAEGTLAIGIVWHTGCPKYRCEGLRVLGTWIKPGWGLGIPEIGRTGISSPRNKCRRGNQANPQQTTPGDKRQVML